MKLNPSHPALEESRTIHMKYRKRPKADSTLLKPVSSNSKLGKGKKVISAHKWEGMPMFSLTLEERATCPTSCHHWDDCYGNGMPFAHRWTEGKPLENKLFRELLALNDKYPQGIVVRLHILGDFYSFQYVMFWESMLQVFPNLHIFGYTAWEPDTDIGYTVSKVRGWHPDRFWVRYSRPGQPDGNAIYAAHGDYDGKHFVCPEQTEKVDSCLDCGLCWTTKQTVRFLTH